MPLGIAVAVPILLTLAIALSNDNLPVPTAAAASSSDRGAMNASTVRFTEEGKLRMPKGYRRWPFVGTPVTPNDMNGGQAPFPEFHTVYINPEAFEHFDAAGEFPDGTVLVKELVSVGAKRASSGKGYFMGDFIGLEASVKDKTRFADEPGNWAYFSFGHELPLKRTASPQPTANCNVCHGGAAEDDFVFTQYYPVLGEMKHSPKQEKN